MNNLAVTTQDMIPDIPKRGMPITIITGFLGSGKTTLLNQILKNKENLKVAVLVNEFGDINIDSQLLVTLDEDMVELSNGCICCTINEGLVEAVYRILERQDRIDYLVIETTGVADPFPIILTFVTTELRDLVRIDSVITMIDSETFTPDHFDSEAALKQVAYGDIILLNKTDLVSEQALTYLEKYIRTLKPGARILHTQYGQVPLPLILDIDVPRPEVYPETSQVNLQHHSEEHGEHHHPSDHDHNHDDDHNHDHNHDHDHHHSDHLATDGFVSVSFQSDRPFSSEKFLEFLDQLPDNVFRAKGILWFTESSARHIFQLSGKRYQNQIDQWVKPPSNQIVLIGRNLQIEELQQLLNQCVVDG